MRKLRPNKAKLKLQQGQVVTAVSGLITADIVDYMGPIGLDAVWVEAEHGPIDFGNISDITRSCDLWDATSIVRVNLNLPGVIYRTLDLGAQGIVVPHVNTVAEAEAVVEAAKFYPLGNRGNFTSRQGYGVEDYVSKANDETLVIILIEDIISINNLREILAVNHIDVFFVAPGDLAQTMGFPGQPEHPEVVSVVEAAIHTITEMGKVAGSVVTDETAEARISAGARFLYCSWMPWLETGAKNYLSKIANASR